jgi:hypothetical protein
MNIDGYEVGLTYSEANFIERSCSQEDAPLVVDIRNIMNAGILNWAIDVLPAGISEIPPPEGEFSLACKHATMKAIAALSYNDGSEAIKIRLKAEHLQAIKGLACCAIEKAQNSAGNIGITFEICSDILDSLYPEDADEDIISEADEESLKAQAFEDELSRIAIGHSIIAAIDKARS